MGAQPKNKITRVERGKRRAGNTPSLKKDPKVSKVPLHKKSLLSKFGKVAAAAGKKTTFANTAAKAGTQASAAPTKIKTSKSSPTKATKRTPVSRGK